MENQSKVTTLFPQGKYENLRPQVKPVEATHAEMVEMRKLGKLIPGQWYRITDYVTTVNQHFYDNARSVGHAFDLLVMAESATMLQEKAFAIQHTGDTYFGDSRLEAWEVKYRLDNVQWSLQAGTYMKSDTDGGSYGFVKQGTIVLGGATYILWKGDSAFSEDWADYAVSEDENEGTTLYAYYGDPEDFSPDEEVGVIDTLTVETNEGKGTIIWMKDEFNNECPYDFKNIQFKRYITTDDVDGRSGLDRLYMIADPNNPPSGLIADDDTNFIWAFTFSSDNSGGEQMDYSLGGQDVYGNTIKEMGNGTLNNIVFFGNYNGNMSFGNQCYSMSFGNSNSRMSFGNSNSRMSFGNYNNNMSFGNECYSMSFGNSNYNMSFGNSNGNMSFGNSNRNMSFGNSNGNMSFGDECYSMSFGNQCSTMIFGNFNRNMSFGNQCNYMSFGNQCNYMSFGNECYRMSFGDSCKNGTITEGVNYVDIATNTWNFQLLNGLEGTSSNHLTPSFATSKAYTQVACKNSSGQLVVYVPGDLA